MRKLLLWLVRFLDAPRVIFDRDGSSPYLSRWYFLGDRYEQDDDLVEQGKGWSRRFPLAPFLHRFHRSDDDVALHSHPWKWGLSFVLVGGYWEERRVGDRVVRRLVKPFRFNFLRADTYHRVDLLEEDAWTVFLAGPPAGTWYFWDRHRKARCHWRAFIRARRGDESTSPWEPDVREST